MMMKWWKVPSHHWQLLPKARIKNVASFSTDRFMTVRAVQSLKLYSKKYNSTLIPQHYAVPEGDDYWPRDMWGEKIGSRISVLRNHYKNNLLTDHDIKLLESNGMYWNGRRKADKKVDKINTAASFSINVPLKSLVDAMKVYKKLFNTTNIPHQYKVTIANRSKWPAEFFGKSVGSWLHQTRAAYEAGTLTQDEIQMLEDGGIQWSAPDMQHRSRWLQRAVVGLLKYHQLYNSTSIPKKFVVPRNSSQWPANLHGDELGLRIDNLKEAYYQGELKDGEAKTLEEAGMQWGAPPPHYFRTWILRLADGLVAFNKINGTTLIPNLFVVPSSEDPASRDWPSQLHGMALGTRLKGARQAYRRKFLSQPDIELLEDAGMQWTDPSRRYYHSWVKRLADQLVIYNKLYGTTAVPQAFVVPKAGETNSEFWPSDFHGEKLGLRLHRARIHYKAGTLKQEKTDILESAGIEWRNRTSANRKAWLHTLAEAIKYYKKLYPESNDISTLYVTSTDGSWPQHLSGYNLGFRLRHARASYKSLAQKDRTMLEDAGIQWVAPSKKYRGEKAQRLAAGLKIYSKLYNSTCVPQLFVVPRDSPDWPKEFHDDKLGSRLSNTRTLYAAGKLSKEDIATLEDAGILWKIRKSR